MIRMAVELSSDKDMIRHERSEDGPQIQNNIVPIVNCRVSEDIVMVVSSTEAPVTVSDGLSIGRFEYVLAVLVFPVDFSEITIGVTQEYQIILHHT